MRIAIAVLTLAAGVSWAENARVVEPSERVSSLQLRIVAANPTRKTAGIVASCGTGTAGPGVMFVGGIDVPRRDIQIHRIRTDHEPGVFSSADEAREFGVYSDTAEFGAIPQPEDGVVDMTYRFDQGKADRVPVRWTSDGGGIVFAERPRRYSRYAYPRGYDREEWERVLSFDDWMALLEQSDMLIVKFGRGRVDRYDLLAARPAISDFKSRCIPVPPAPRVETNGRFGE